MARGGSWNNNRENARSACRNNNDPGNRNNNLGFRVSCVSHIEQSFASQSFASVSRHCGTGEAPQDVPEMPCDHGCTTEAKDLWMAQASPVRTAVRSSGA